MIAPAMRYENQFKGKKYNKVMRVKIEQPYLDEFFGLIEKRNDFISWTGFSKKLKTTTRSSLKEMKEGNWTLPEKTYAELLNFISVEKKDYFKDKETYLPNGWATQERWDKKLLKIKKEIETKTEPWHLELKARLCGYISGDGLVKMRFNKNQKTPRYDFGFYPDDLMMAKSFNDAFFELYGRRFIVRKSKEYNNYILRGTHKEAYLDLIKLGSFGTYDWNVPFEFLTTTKMKTEWIKAFFDAEAHVGKRQIQVQSVNKKGLEEVKQLLEEVGIITSKIYTYKRKQKNWNINYLLAILRKSEFKNYLKLVGFNHSSKKDKLKSLVARMAESGSRRHARTESFL